MPKENKKDLEDVPKEVVKDLKFVFVSHMDEALPVFLTHSLPEKQKGTEKKESRAGVSAILHAPAPIPVD
jgi:ATP-dependent Lon protease